MTIPLHGQKNLQAFNTGEISKRHIKYSFKINGKQLMPTKDKYAKFQNYSPFIVMHILKVFSARR